MAWSAPNARSTGGKKLRGFQKGRNIEANGVPKVNSQVATRTPQ